VRISEIDWTEDEAVRRLPAFADDAEERRFWETHSFADYFSQMRPVSVQVSKKLRKRVAARKTK
jgi:hypothetical protein